MEPISAHRFLRDSRPDAGDRELLLRPRRGPVQVAVAAGVGRPPVLQPAAGRDLWVRINCGACAKSLRSHRGLGRHFASIARWPQKGYSRRRPQLRSWWVRPRPSSQQCATNSACPKGNEANRL